MRIFVILAGACWALWPAGSEAAVFTVPTKAFPTIQSGVDAAMSRPGTNEVRVAGGRYHEHVTIASVVDGGRLVVTGGWNRTFDRADGSVSTLDAGGVGTALAIAVEDGAVTFGRFTITGAAAPSPDGRMPAAIEVAARDIGAVTLVQNTVTGNALTGDLLPLSAVVIEVSDRAQVDLGQNTIHNNSVTAKGGSGAGLYATVSGPGRLILGANRITSNYLRATDLGYTANAAGAYVRAASGAYVRLEKNLFEGNKASARGNAFNAALVLQVSSGAYASVYGNHFIGNRTESEAGDARRTVSLLTSGLGPDGVRPVIHAVRNQFLGNTVQGSTSEVLRMSAGEGDIRFSDSLVAGGNSGGVYARAIRGGGINITNVTIAANGGRSLQVAASATGEIVNLSNSILYGNGTDAPGGSPFMTANLVGVDPLFVSATDYRVRAGSLAIDRGNASPPGGLSPSDLVGRNRVMGMAVDIGAYEQ